MRVRPKGDTGRARQGEIPAERWVERDAGFEDVFEVDAKRPRIEVEIYEEVSA